MLSFWLSGIWRVGGWVDRGQPRVHTLVELIPHSPGVLRLRRAAPISLSLSLGVKRGVVRRRKGGAAPSPPSPSSTSTTPSPLCCRTTNIMDPSNSWDEGWQEVQDPVLTSLPVDSSEDLMQPATGSGLYGVDLARTAVRPQQFRLNRSAVSLEWRSLAVQAKFWRLNRSSCG